MLSLCPLGLKVWPQPSPHDPSTVAPLGSRLAVNELNVVALVNQFTVYRTLAEIRRHLNVTVWSLPESASLEVSEYSCARTLRAAALRRSVTVALEPGRHRVTRSADNHLGALRAQTRGGSRARALLTMGAPAADRDGHDQPRDNGRFESCRGRVGSACPPTNGIAPCTNRSTGQQGLDARNLVVDLNQPLTAMGTRWGGGCPGLATSNKQLGPLLLPPPSPHRIFFFKRRGCTIVCTNQNSMMGVYNHPPPPVRHHLDAPGRGCLAIKKSSSTSIMTPPGGHLQHALTMSPRRRS